MSSIHTPNCVRIKRVRTAAPRFSLDGTCRLTNYEAWYYELLNACQLLDATVHRVTHHISVNSISIFPLVSWGKSLNLCVLQKLTAEKDNINLFRMLLGLILDLDLIDHRYLLPHEPICSLAERVIWDQILHEDVLLATLGHWACADPICGAAETALQALIAARAEATWCHCRTLDKFRAELAFERGW